MDYTNTVNIAEYQIYGGSEGSPFNTGEPCSFGDRLVMRSKEGVLGADLEIAAVDARFKRNFYSSGIDYFLLDYSQGAGATKAIVFNPETTVIEDIAASGNRFTGSLSGSEYGLFSNGAGQSIGNDPGSFIHNMVLNHNGKSAKTESFLKSYGGQMYEWYSNSGSVSGEAYSHFESHAYRGKSIVKLGITGFSGVFPYNQRAPEKPEDYPAIIYPEGLIKAEHLYMDWFISSMG
jgi:hypothetical protein